MGSYRAAVRGGEIPQGYLQRTCRRLPPWMPWISAMAKADVVVASSVGEFARVREREEEPAGVREREEERLGGERRTICGSWSRAHAKCIPLMEKVLST